MHELWIIFNWPNGIVVGNLMASVIWASLFEWRLRVHHKKIHELVRRHHANPEPTAESDNC